MKKWIAIFLVLSIVSAVVPNNVYASETTCVEGEKVSAKRDSDVQMRLFLHNNPGIAYLRVTVSCDSDTHLTEVVKGDNGNNSIFKDLDVGLNLAWNDDKDVTTDGVLATLTFHISETAALGKHNVRIIIRECYNEAFDDVSVSVVDGQITVVENGPNELEDFEYSIVNGEIAIEGYQGTAKDIIIGKEYEVSGSVYSVTSIAESAFEGTEDITSVVIPETVAQVGEYAFYDCMQLKNITLLSKDTNIGDLAFGYYHISRKLDGLVPGVTIYGYEGSTAEAYANENDIAFSALSTPIKLAGASITLENNIAVNFKARKSDLEEAGCTNPYVKCQFGEQESIITEHTLNDGYYVFRFANISPDRLNDNMVVTLHATQNGEEVQSDAVNYSVAQYCYNMLNKYSSDEYAELRTLLVDLLHYGAKSQIYTSHNVSNLADAKLTAAQLAWGSSDNEEYENALNREYQTVDNPSVTWSGAGLNLTDRVEMRFRFAATDVSSLKFKVTDDYGNTSYIQPSSFEGVSGSENEYYAYFSELDASQMDKVIYVTAYINNQAVSNTLRYSIESYAYTKSNDSQVQLAELVKAMMAYGRSAKAYKGGE